MAMAMVMSTCRSTVPSAFSGYSFHIVEALLLFANEILFAFVLPLHLGLHRAYHLFTTIIHQGAPSYDPIAQRERRQASQHMYVSCCH